MTVTFVNGIINLEHNNEYNNHKMSSTQAYNITTHKHTKKTY